MAQVIFRCVGVGVEQVGRFVHQPRLLGVAVEQVVEIAVHAQQQVGAAFGNHIQQYALAFGQVLPRRNADFEFEPVGFVVVENAAPESHVVVSFDKYLHQPVISVRITRNDGKRGGLRFFAVVAFLFFHRLVYSDSSTHTTSIPTRSSNSMPSELWYESA